jgi:hypothetical protein
VGTAGGCCSVNRVSAESRERGESGHRFLFIPVVGRNLFFLNRFGSVRVNRFLHYKIKNRTEPEIFLTILIGLISFFSRFSFLGFFGFPVCLITPSISYMPF